MTQFLQANYGADDTAKLHNDHFIGLLPPGVYSGLTVAADGTIAPGVALSAQGIRIEETTSPGKPAYGDQWQYTGVPSNLNGSDTRYDLVVIRYLWEAANNPPTASYRVIQGVAGGAMPVLPNDGHTYIVLATCACNAHNGSGSWDNVTQAGPPEQLFNCTRALDRSYKVIDRNFGALCFQYSPDGGLLVLFMLDPFTLPHNGDTITWGDPVLTIRKQQIDEFIAATGAGKIGVTAATGANAILSILTGTLQAALDKLVADGDAALKANATAISNHTGSTSGAHAATALNVAAATGANGVLAILAGTIQAAFNKIILDGDAALHGNATAISNHTGANSGAHNLSAITLADVANRIAATDPEGALAEIFQGHRLNGTVLDHGPIEQDFDALRTFENGYWGDDFHSACRIYTGMLGSFRYSLYIYGDNSGNPTRLQIAMNATLDAGGIWRSDDNAYPSYLVTIAPYFAYQTGTSSSGYAVTWATAITKKYGTGAPSGTPPAGSEWHRTDAASGHSGIYVYNSYLGWLELAVV